MRYKTYFINKIREDNTMKLKDTGLTFQDIKDKVDKYMIETYERFDFWLRQQKISICMTKTELLIWIFMQESL